MRKPNKRDCTMKTTKIEWTDVTWNPVTGCDKISSGCRNCYASRMAGRLQLMKNPRYGNGFKVTLHHDLITAPLAWKKPARVFVNSMADLFHEEVPLSFIQKCFATMAQTPHLTYQILTKRAERLSNLSPFLQWPKNVWQGISIENIDVLERVNHLRKVPATVRFISAEPLIGSLKDLDLNGIHWLIAGGESGPGAREMKKEWVLELRDMCRESKTAFFFKQWGGVRKHLNGRELDRRTWDEFPSV